jgi:crossover junction endodeoxyribonuclease RuvC
VQAERRRRVRALDYGWFSTSAGTRLELRLAEIYDQVAELVDRFEPDAIAIEESYVGTDARTALVIGQARGAILVACAKSGVPPVQYAPATVKQAICGWGRADKAQVQKMVGAILGLERAPTPHHAADALAVAVCHAFGAPMRALAGARA